jgi:soluble lytic murein transglycosylase-like protein
LAVKTGGGTTRRRTSRGANKRKNKQEQFPVRYLPVYVLLVAIVAMMLPTLLVMTAEAALDVAAALPGWTVSAGEYGLQAAGDALRWAGGEIRVLLGGRGEVAPLFTAPVSYWAGDINRWAGRYDLDPNLLATVMQIESCGHPTVRSHAGAQGLFQVMPYHFERGESQLDPDTNARRGAGVLRDCLQRANGDAGLAMACYNGGPGVLARDFNAWPGETQRFYRWGTGIYADAQRGRDHSDTLDQWLAAGGINLCLQAATALGLD